MNIKVRGIVINAKDYKEKDKLITLYTAEYGKITALLKGVKNLNAKLKYAKELFCFGEYFLTAKSGMYIVTGCDVIESFSEFRKDINKFLEASYIITTLNKIIESHNQNIGLFFDLISCLKSLEFYNPVEKIVSCKFILGVLEHAGYALNLDSCPICKNAFKYEKYYNPRLGVFVCKGCKSSDSIFVENVIFNNIRLIFKSEYDKLHLLKLKNIENVLIFLNQLLQQKFNVILQLY